MVPFLFMIIVKQKTMSINAYPHRTGSIHHSITNYIRQRDLKNLEVFSEWIRDVDMEWDESEPNEYMNDSFVTDSDVDVDSNESYIDDSNITDSIDDSNITEVEEEDNEVQEGDNEVQEVMDYECSTLYDFKVLDTSLDCTF